MCSRGIALLQRLGLTVSQEAVTARQKSAEGILGVQADPLERDTDPKGQKAARAHTVVAARRRPERFPVMNGVNGSGK